MPVLRIKDSPAKRFAVIAFVLSPLAVLAGLCWLMYLSLRHPPVMDARPRGAGAGHTGMSNEYMGIGKDRPKAAPSPAPSASSPAPK